MPSSFQIISPIDGRVFYGGPYLEKPDALARAAAAREAQRAWRATPVTERVAVCLRMLDAYEARADEYAEQISRMMGKPLADSRGEARGMRGRVEYLCSIAEATLADEVLPTADMPGFHRLIRHEPVGVVMDIAAWNYPLLVAINAIAAGVLAGDAVLIKHAPQTALVGQQLARSFQEAGAPEDLVCDFMVDHETAAEVLAGQYIDHVVFTGSVRGGHEVYRAIAAHSFAGASFELGGKDAAYVRADCDLEFTAANLVEGAFYNAGQSCCAVERIYVHAQVWDRFIEAYTAGVHDLRPGDPLAEGTTLGPVVSADAALRIDAQVAEALSKGARLLNDTGRVELPTASSCYLAPRALIDVDHTMTIMRDESFGPVIGLMKVSDDDDAAAMMNDSRYGLTASIWTADDEAALAIGDRLEVGTVFQNRCDYLDPGLPWVGVRDSGRGVSLSRYGIRALTRPKSFHMRKRG